MEWKREHRERLYRILETKWAFLDTEAFEEWLASLGIRWAELHHENDAPQGTVAVWEGPGIEDPNLKLCWVVPDEVAHKMILLGFP